MKLVLHNSFHMYGILIEHMWCLQWNSFQQTHIPTTGDCFSVKYLVLSNLMLHSNFPKLFFNIQCCTKSYFKSFLYQSFAQVMLGRKQLYSATKQISQLLFKNRKHRAYMPNGLSLSFCDSSPSSDSDAQKPSVSWIPHLTHQKSVPAVNWLWQCRSFLGGI